jgi:RNA polymerase sigma-70 factor (ECF subfamily)
MSAIVVADAGGLGSIEGQRAPRYAARANARTVASMADADVDDSQLMLAYATRNDLRAFELLYGRHRSALYRYLMRQTHDPEVTNDLFQEVWSRVIDTRARYEPRAKFRTFLFTLAHNCFIDHCRRTKARPAGTSIDDADAADLLAAPDAVRPDVAAESAQWSERFRRALATLPADQRDAFLLHEESNLSVEDIALVMGVGAETAKSRLRYAMNKLKQLLAIAESRT